MRTTESEKGLCMPGLPSAVAPPADLVAEPLTASQATEAVGAVLRQILDERLRHCRAVDPVFAQELATRLAALVERGGKRLRTAFAHCGWRAAGGTGDV
ncbi:polyprenyl synthetase family protein, partial [Streptomyces sp. WAC08452]